MLAFVRWKERGGAQLERLRKEPQADAEISSTPHFPSFILSQYTTDSFIYFISCASIYLYNYSTITALTQPPPLKPKRHLRSHGRRTSLYLTVSHFRLLRATHLYLFELTHADRLELPLTRIISISELRSRPTTHDTTAVSIKVLYLANYITHITRLD